MKKFLLSLVAILFLSGCTIHSQAEYTYDKAEEYVEYKEELLIAHH